MALSVYDYPPMTVFFIVLAAALGLVMGSFLHCAAWRIARNESFLKGRSRCPQCGHTLTAVELIPVFSWLVQKGRCRACGQRIPIRYPLTELLFALISVLCLLRFDLTAECLRNYVFLCCLLCLTLTDLDEQIIPDGCHIISAAAWLLALPFTFAGWTDTGLRLLAVLVFGGGVLGISLIMDRIMNKDTLGGGDIKLIAVAALYLGLLGSLFMLIFACVIGLLFAAILKKGRSSIQFPFGPSISLATWICLLFGNYVTDWYLGLLR